LHGKRIAPVKQAALVPAWFALPGAARALNGKPTGGGYLRSIFAVLSEDIHNKALP
jgi:hypothetical protein